MPFKFWLCFLLSIPAFFATAQDESKSSIQSISFEGAKRNKLSYLNHIAGLNTEENLSREEIELGLQRLKNIASIAEAYYQIDTLKEGLQLNYTIKERQTLLPILNFGGVEGNLWLRAGVIDNNWQGKGHDLLAYYQNTDRRHSGHFFYRNPNVKNSQWGYTFVINKWASLEPVFFDEGTVNYLYDNNGFGFTILRHIDRRRRIEIGSTFFVESYRQADDQFLENPPGPVEFAPKKWLLKLIYNKDFLNYDFFYLTGHDWHLLYQDVFNTYDQTWFKSLRLQSRFFIRPAHKLNLAGRVRLAISTNEDTPFAPFVLDSFVNIRGVGNRIDRGTAQAIFNLEGRYSIFHKQKWASQAVIFSDLGTWRKPGGSFRELVMRKSFRHFVGAGIRLIYPKVYNAIFRIDYGIDIYDANQRGFVIGLGQYF